MYVLVTNQLCSNETCIKWNRKDFFLFFNVVLESRPRRYLEPNDKPKTKSDDVTLYTRGLEGVLGAVIFKVSDCNDSATRLTHMIGN